MGIAKGQNFEAVLYTTSESHGNNSTYMIQIKQRNCLSLESYVNNYVRGHVTLINTFYI